MKIISGLSLTLCAISMVMAVIYGLLPESNPTRPLIKSLSEFICVAVILSGIFSVIKGGAIDFNKFSADYYSTDIEDYVAESNSVALLKRVKIMTEEIFKQYSVQCNKISIQESGGEGYLQFNVNETETDFKALETDLYKKTNIMCKVIID